MAPKNLIDNVYYLPPGACLDLVRPLTFEEKYPRWVPKKEPDPVYGPITEEEAIMQQEHEEAAAHLREYLTQQAIHARTTLPPEVNFDDCDRWKWVDSYPDSELDSKEREIKRERARPVKKWTL